MLIMPRVKSVKVGGHYSLLTNSFILMTVIRDHVQFCLWRYLML